MARAAPVRRALVVVGVALASLAMVSLAIGCAEAHGLHEDAGRVDATPHDTALGDAARPDAVSLERVTCGPNRCALGEICCNEACGICAFASECVDHGCGGP